MSAALSAMNDQTRDLMRRADELVEAVTKYRDNASGEERRRLRRAGRALETALTHIGYAVDDLEGHT